MHSGADRGYKPEQIDVVVITHGHPDHIGGLMEGGKPVYPNARYVFGEAEFDYWKKGENIAENRKANREQFMQVAVPFGEKATFLKGEGEVVPGIRSFPCLDIRGMMAYHIESDGQRLLNWADVANHYVMAIQQPEWHVSFDDDKEMGVATRKRIFDMVCQREASRRRLPHAVPIGRLRGEAGDELSLGARELPLQPLTPRPADTLGRHR